VTNIFKKCLFFLRINKKFPVFLSRQYLKNSCLWYKKKTKNSVQVAQKEHIK